MATVLSAPIPKKESQEDIYHNARNYEMGKNVSKDLKKAFDLYMAAHTKKCFKATFKVGFFYANGLGGIKQDWKQAFYYYKIAAKEGILEAQSEFGKCQIHGYGTATDITGGLKYLESVANTNSFAVSTLIDLYVNGIPSKLEKNIKKANELIIRAEKTLNPQLPNADIISIIGIAITLINGLNGFKNEHIGHAILAKAAHLKNPLALYHLGNCYLHGLGITTDVAEGIKLLKEAASLNHVDAMFILGKFYQQDLKSPKESLEIAIQYYRSAINLDHPEAYYELGLILKNSLLPKCKLEAFTYFSRASTEFEHLGARYELGLAYLYGSGIKKDIGKARTIFSELDTDKNKNAKFQCLCTHIIEDIDKKDYYNMLQYMVELERERRSNPENVEASFFLAMILENDWTENKDLYRAFQLYQLGDGKNHAPSIRRLAIFYKKGDCDLSIDEEKVFELYTRAANLGDLEAGCKLAKCYYRGYGTLTNHKKAFEMYELLESNNVEDVILDLGECYLFGEGTEKNIEKAIKYLNLVIERELELSEVKEACIHLGNHFLEINHDKSIEYLSKVKIYSFEACKLLVMALEKKMEKLNQQLSQSKKENDQLSSNGASLAEAQTKLKKMADTILKDLNALKTERDVTKAEHKRTKDELVEANWLLDRERTQILDMKSEIVQLNTKIEDLQLKINEWKKKLFDKKTELEALQSKLKEQEKTNAKLQKNVEKLPIKAKEIEDLTQKLANADKLHSELRGSLDSLNKLLNQNKQDSEVALAKEKAEKDQALEQEKERGRKLQAELDLMKSKENSWSQEKAAHDRLQREKEQALVLEREKNERLLKEMTALKDELNAKNTQLLNQTKALNAKSITELENARKLTAAETLLKTVKRESDQAIEREKTAILAKLRAVRENESLCAQNQTLSQSNSDLNTKISTLSSEISAAQKKEAEANERKMKAEQEAVDLRKEIQRQNTLISQLNEKNRALDAVQSAFQKSVLTTQLPCEPAQKFAPTTYSIPSKINSASNQVPINVNPSSIQVPIKVPSPVPNQAGYQMPHQSNYVLTQYYLNNNTVTVNTGAAAPGRPLTPVAIQYQNVVPQQQPQSITNQQNAPTQGVVTQPLICFTANEMVTFYPIIQYK